MIPMTAPPSRSVRRWLLPSLCLLGLACGSADEAPLGEREQPITAPENENDDSETPAACEGGVVHEGDPGDACQVVARGLCFATPEAACACAGCALEQCAIAESFPGQAFCQNESPGSGDPDAPVSSGPIGGGTNGSSGNTSPGNPGCGSADPGAPGQTDPSPPTGAACEGGRLQDPSSSDACDFIVGGYCFEDAEAACACAGCGGDACLILESYPAQIACQ